MKRISADIHLTSPLFAHRLESYDYTETLSCAAVRIHLFL
jgi:hypothetical protein